jgi:hypothetical protein
MVAVLALVAAPGHAQEPSQSPNTLYDQALAFALSGEGLAVEDVRLTRDRAEIAFTGTFYFSTPVSGRVTGAVFQGQGTFLASVPPGAFEQDNVRRLLKADTVESSFETAAMVFTDESFQQIASAGRRSAAALPADVKRRAAAFMPRMLKETGVNLAARAAASIFNQESPGFFFAEFDGGRRGRFSLLLDYQNRIPVANFGLNSGEKGLIFAYRQGLYGNDIWMAFYSLADYARGTAAYSDASDLIDITHYNVDLDLRDPGKALKMTARMDMIARADHLRVLPLSIGESLPEHDDLRLKQQLRLKAVRVDDTPAVGIQEDWEGGLSVLLPTETSAGRKMTVELVLEGDFMREVERLAGCYYPASNSEWMPRHGYLDRATFDLTFHHSEHARIAATGTRILEVDAPGSKDERLTQYRMAEPVARAVFALGPFERHAQTIRWEHGGETPLEFSALPDSMMPVKEDFVLAELDNAVRYFTALFGNYPYSTFGAAVHPYGFGQGFATLLMIPPASTSRKETFAFIAHETAHQWWGNIVAWRSFRDQWLSEGFAEYSGVLYAGRRDGAQSQRELIDALRESLKNPPRTTLGVGTGRLNDVGPLILGRRLETRQTMGSYSALVYGKGALVLRMLHYLLTDPATGNDQPFFDMMTDFVNRFRGATASTDDFRTIAGIHFAKSPLASKYGLKNLDWFFTQYVYQVPLPSYRFEYSVEEQSAGAVLLRGTLFQDNAPAGWLMMLPLLLTFGGDKMATVTVQALGPQSTVTLKLPGRPNKVELDPANWILSENATTRRR